MGEGRGQIFHLEASGQLVALEETPFELEEHFESLIADHPDLLPGDQVDPEDPRRWLVVGHQIEIPSESTSWALDLLLVDQEGIPTFVELEKGSNPELRRKVVGQMLDYAASKPLLSVRRGSPDMPVAAPRIPLHDSKRSSWPEPTARGSRVRLFAEREECRG